MVIASGLELLVKILVATPFKGKLLSATNKPGLSLSILTLISPPLLLFPSALILPTRISPSSPEFRVTSPPSPLIPRELISPVVIVVAESSLISPPVVPELLIFPVAIAPSGL